MVQPGNTYIILAHQRPDAVLRLAKAILSDVPSARIVVHYSVSAGLFPEPADDRIVVVEKPVAVAWGNYSQVEMLMRSIEELRCRGLPDAWVVVLSGQCYPIRNVAGFERMLGASTVDAFIRCAPIGPREPVLRERATFRYRPVVNGPLPFPLNVRAVRGVINRLQPFVRVKSTPRLSFVGRARRTSIYDLMPAVYHATQWIALSRRAVTCLRETLATRPEIVAAYEESLFSEESLFATILMNDPRVRVHPDDFHYVDWSTIRTGSPKTLTVADLEPMVQSGKWFARKVMLDTPDTLRDELDVHRTADGLTRLLRCKR